MKAPQRKQAMKKEPVVDTITEWALAGAARQAVGRALVHKVRLAALQLAVWDHEMTLWGSEPGFLAGGSRDNQAIARLRMLLRTLLCGGVGWAGSLRTEQTETWQACTYPSINGAELAERLERGVVDVLAGIVEAGRWEANIKLLPDDAQLGVHRTLRVMLATTENYSGSF